jgi:hypothetical protein
MCVEAKLAVSNLFFLVKVVACNRVKATYIQTLLKDGGLARRLSHSKEMTAGSEAACVAGDSCRSETCRICTSVNSCLY